MQTRYMERTNSMKGRGKRNLEGGGDEEQEPERKRPALARYRDYYSSFAFFPLVCVSFISAMETSVSFLGKVCESMRRGGLFHFLVLLVKCFS